MSIILNGAELTRDRINNNLTTTITINGLLLTSAFPIFVAPDLHLRWGPDELPAGVHDPLSANDTAYRVYSVCVGFALGFLIMGSTISWALMYLYGQCIRDIDFVNQIQVCGVWGQMHQQMHTLVRARWLSSGCVVDHC